ncbi:DUF1028 domain-containing protein [Rhodovulum sp. YNF3179]|uniref:DUF1028 domain-containing protein n=1 Tax=Rhodovulum sp. YNF3179 TaxID=3425127 RepID=UPI003D3357B1
MTFSLLALDRETGTLGGAAATGSLCVGGWVLRGDIRAGLSASQGAAPSTFWGEDVLSEMARGVDAPDAVAHVTGRDHGRAHRQLTALDLRGHTGAFTGAANAAAMGSRALDAGVVAGNLLTSEAVLDAVGDTFGAVAGPMAERLLAALEAGAAAGSDSRGLQSAALLVLSPDTPPLTLRVDWAESPLAALRALYEKSRETPYADWLGSVPVLNDPERGPG